MAFTKLLAALEDGNKLLEPNDTILKTKPLIRQFANTSNEYFLWTFGVNSDIKLFKNAKNGDIITSNKFMVNGCTFFLECTPNGWSYFDGTIIWLALDELPNNVYSIKLHYKYGCDEVSFIGEKTQIVTTKQIAMTKGSGAHSLSSNNKMSFGDFEYLNSFSFKCYVKIIEFYDVDGNIINYKQNDNDNDNEVKTNEIINELKQKISRLENENCQTNEQILQYAQTNSLLQEENKKIKSQKEGLERMVDELLNNQTKLQNENNNLNEECKELRLEINEIKDKYNELSKKIKSDVRNYKNWDHDDITNWIISLNKEYEKYENCLRNKLKEESMNGSFLNEWDKTDLDRFGIKSYGDKSTILKHIKDLVSQQNNNNNNNEGQYQTVYH